MIQMCNCNWDWCEFFNVFFGGLFVSVIASFLISCLLRRRNRKRYGKIHGEFHSIVNGNVSYASVTYVDINTLEIQVRETNENKIWIGFVSLYNIWWGKIDWMYSYPEHVRQWFGIKKIVIIDSNNFHIIGDPAEDFGIEKFSRVPIKNENLIQFINRILRYYLDI